MPLLLLSAGIFVAVTSEFLPIGLLPQLRDEPDVTEAQVGLLVTVFAAAVVIATAPLTHLTRRVPRKRLLLALLAVFAVANLVAALTPGYAVLVVARVVGGAAHGVFWAVVTPYAARLVPPERLARAVAVVAAGATVATVAGVPLGTLLGAAVGWRASFAVIAGLVVVIALAIVAVLPAVAHGVADAAPDAAADTRRHRDPTLAPVLVLCVTVVLVTLGHAAFHTYIAAWVIDVAGFATAAVAPVLLAFGAAGAAGVALAGVLGDRYPRALLPIMLTGVIAAVAGLGVVGLGVVAASPAASADPVVVVVLIVAWSAFLGGVPVIFQARLLQLASPALRDIGAAWITVAFNLGIGGGALLGGVVLELWSLGALPVVASALLGAGLLLVLVSLRRPPELIEGDHDGDDAVDDPRDRERGQAG
jgi:predicted MFS family arabinose efflux permease